MNNMHVKKGDTVMCNSGNDAGVKGEVLAAYPKTNKVVVKGVNIRKKHIKPRKQGESGGIIEAEVAIPASKVNIYCSSCKKGVRVRYNVKSDGKKVRVCASCGKELD